MRLTDAIVALGDVSLSILPSPFCYAHSSPLDDRSPRPVPSAFAHKGGWRILEARERVGRIVERLPVTSDTVQIARDARDNRWENKGQPKGYYR
jgi:hypothetical protein